MDPSRRALGISEKPSPLLPSFCNRLLHLIQPTFHIHRQMYTQCATLTFGQNLKIATRLRCLDDAESVFLLRYGQIDGVIAGDLQEYAAVGAAFVRLSG